MNNNGKWIKYERNGNYTEMYNAIKDFDTGWCINSLEEAEHYLGLGDIFIYFNDKFPHVLFRTEGKYMAEVRGVAKNQNLESGYEDIVKEKLDEYPNGYLCDICVKHMKYLSSIYDRYKNGNISLEDWNYIYELDMPIFGFGSDIDPRLEEIRNSRNIITDLNYLFDVREEPIRDLNLYYLNEAKGLKFPTTIYGSLWMDNLTDASMIRFPNFITGDLSMSRLKEGKGLDLFNTEIGKNLVLFDLEDGNGFSLPNIIHGSLFLPHLKRSSFLRLPRYIGGSLNISSFLDTDHIYSNNTYIGGNLMLFNYVAYIRANINKLNVQGQIIVDGRKLDCGNIKKRKKNNNE